MVYYIGLTQRTFNANPCVRESLCDWKTRRLEWQVRIDDGGGVPKECERVQALFLGWKVFDGFQCLANTWKLHTRVCTCILFLCQCTHAHILRGSFNQLLPFSTKVKYHCKNMKRPCRDFNYFFDGNRKNCLFSFKKLLEQQDQRLVERLKDYNKTLPHIKF